MPDVKEGVSLTHAYKYHKEKRRKEGKKVVKQALYRNVLYSFNQKVVSKVLQGFHTQLPYHMGFIRIIGHKGNLDRLAVDFKATKEMGMTIYHDNRHTDGHWFEWDWRKPNHLVKNMIHYTFVPTRGNKGRSMKEKLSAILRTRNGYRRYMILP